MWNKIHTKMCAPIVLRYEALLLGNRFLVFRRNVSAFQTLGNEYPVSMFLIYEKRSPQPHDLETLKIRRCQCVLQFWVKCILKL